MTLSSSEEMSTSTNELPALIDESTAATLVTGKKSVFQPFPELEKEVGSKNWYFVLGISAFLDFVSKVVKDWVKSEEEVEVLKRNPFDFQHKVGAHQGIQHDPLVVLIIQWLDKYSIPIGMVFSTLWFIDAFVRAQRRRDRTLQKLYRADIMDDSAKQTDEEKVDAANAALRTYYFTVFVQVIMLPIGFYLLMFHILQKPDQVDEFLLDEDEMMEITFLNRDGSVDETSSFSFHTGHSTALALLRYLGTVVARVTGVRIKQKIKAFTRRMSRRAGVFAIRHPRLFTHRARMFMKGLRWLKYLAPLIGTSNKLKGNLQDLFKKLRQEHQAQQAQRKRKQEWIKQLKSGDTKAIETKAALMVQSAFRRNQAQKGVKVLKVWLLRKETKAALKVQAVLRRKLAQARIRIALKRKELEELGKKRTVEKKKKEEMNEQDKRQMVELKDELQKEANELINKRMLLRPDTRFAVTWKILFVFCVLFEIGQLAFSPVLKKYVDKETGDQMDIGKVMEKMLVPKAFKNLPQCGAVHIADDGVEAKGILSFLKRLRRKKAQEVIIADHTKHPWFCHPPYSTIQGVYIDLLHFLILDFLVFVGVICFLDVFVTFFTGELHEKNGTLIPKPFFTRWLLPGMLLQLFVNPQMETVGKYVGSLLQEVNRIGQVRVWRWTVALFFPIGKYLYSYIATNFWWPLVHKQNTQNHARRDNR